jgi:hypothetical protein
MLVTGCSAGETPTPSYAQASPPQAGAPMDMPAGAPAAESGDAAPAQDQQRAPSPSPAQPSRPSQPGSAANGSSASSTSAPQNAKSAPADKPRSESLILYTGDVQMNVEAGAQAGTMDSVVDVAESLGGHLAGRANDTVTVKIPSEHFRAGVQKIGKLGDVTSENVSAEDVTAEYHDLEVRIENLRATRKRLEEFLAKAANINDMLTVERELERVAKEMDTIVGRLRFLKEHTAFSVLTVHVTARPKPPPPVVASTPVTSPPPPPRAIDLPVSWFGTLGVDQLLTLPSKK